MIFADLALSKRLERAEGRAGANFVQARLRLFPDCGSEVMEQAGAISIFDGVDSPLTQTFGLGVSEALTPGSLDKIENFFTERGAVAMHEVCPFAGVATLDLLCQRQYRPFEISSVLYREPEEHSGDSPRNVRVRVIQPGEEALWARINAGGWAQEHPELADLIQKLGVVISASDSTLCFLAELDGQPAAAGALRMEEGVALFGGAATLPAFRNRGLQNALLRERLRHAARAGCDLIMMVAEAGSNSQRNAERQGFRLAYTRLKFRQQPILRNPQTPP